MRITSLLFCLLLLYSSCGEKRNTIKESKSQIGQPANFKLLSVLNNIISPVYLTHAGDSRLFIVSQNGIIHIYKDGEILEKPFLDLSNRVEADEGYSEKGLLGMAFHPKYKSNGRFFLYYSIPFKQKGIDHKTVLAEYKVSDGNPDEAENKEKILLEIPQPESNHNGGQLCFGPDGYLYLGLGDGGGANDKHGKIGNGQNLENLLGKILRLEVNSGNPYGIPENNPFAKEVIAKPEIYAYGLRNPWRFSFDRKDGRLFCGDVGQNTLEEIDIIEPGKNYGWKAYEGTNEFEKELIQENMVPPIHEYARSYGNSVIGGYVYRGKDYPELDGKYFFADWSGKIYYLEPQGTNEWIRKSVTLGLAPGNTINSLGEDHQGELYILGQPQGGPNNPNGFIYKITLAK